MSLLDVFAYVFEADTKGFKRGVQEADKQAQDLDKTVKRADQSAAALGGQFRGLIMSAGQALAAYMSVSALMSASAAAAAYADEIGKVSSSLRVNASDLDAWSAAQASAGGTAQGLMSSVGKLRGMLDDLRTKGVSETAYTLQYFGVSLRNASGRMKEPLEILQSLSSRFERLSAARQVDLGKRLGLDDGTIALLQRGRRAVDELVERQRKLGQVTEQDTEISRKYAAQVEETRRAFGRLALDGNSVILPYLTRLYRWFADGIIWIRENQDLVTGFVIGVAGALTAYYLPAIVKAAAATLLWLGPWGLIAAAVTAVGAAIALLWEDLQVFLSGGDSMLGRWAAKWPIVGVAIRALTGDLDAVSEYAEKTMGGLIQRVRAVWETFVGWFRSLGEMFSGLLGGSAAGIMSLMGGGNIAADLSAGQIALSVGGAAPMAATSSSAISNSAFRGGDRTNTVQIDRVEVQTQATDADGISREIGASLDREMRFALDQFDDGVET